MQSHLTCKSCGHESIKNESFLDLSLSLNRCAVPPTSSTQSAVCSDRIARDNRINSTGVDEYGQEVDTAQIQEMGMEIVDQHCEAQPALSLTDCMRSFTTLETLGEKIVRFIYMRVNNIYFK